MNQFSHADYAALWCVHLSILLTAYVAAQPQIRKHARLFTSLVFVALGWAVLSPYYLSIRQNTNLTIQLHLLPALQGLLLAFAGGPLRREADARKNSNQDPGIESFDLYLMMALLAIMVIFPLLYAFSPLPKPDYAVITIAEIFTIVGYSSIGVGIYRLTYHERALGKIAIPIVTIAICFFYVLTQGYWAWCLYHDLYSPMPNRLKYAFAICKVIFTLALVLIVWRQPASADPTHQRPVPRSNDPQVGRLLERAHILRLRYSRLCTVHKSNYYLTRLGALVCAVLFLSIHNQVLSKGLVVGIIALGIVDYIFKPREKWQLYSKADKLLTIFELDIQGEDKQYKEHFEKLFAIEALEMVHLVDLKEILEEAKKKAASASVMSD